MVSIPQSRILEHRKPTSLLEASLDYSLSHSPHSIQATHQSHDQHIPVRPTMKYVKLYWPLPVEQSMRHIESPPHVVINLDVHRFQSLTTVKMPNCPSSKKDIQMNLNLQLYHIDAPGFPSGAIWGGRWRGSGGCWVGGRDGRIGWGLEGASPDFGFGICWVVVERVAPEKVDWLVVQARRQPGVHWRKNIGDIQ